MDSKTKEANKSTIVFFTVDALGHVQSTLPIIRELKKRGHRAVLITTRPLSNAAKLIAQGFEVDSCTKAPEGAGDCENADVLGEIMKPMVESFRRGIREAYEATYKRGGVCEKHILDVMQNHDAYESMLRSYNPDIIVVDHIVGVPCATYVAKRWARIYSGFPSVIYSCFNENYMAGLGLKVSQVTPEIKALELETKRELRRLLGEFFVKVTLKDYEHQIELAPTSPYLNFLMGPQDMRLELEPGIKAPPNWFRLEHCIDEPPRQFDVPQELKDLPGKLIYFSLGTLVTWDWELINRLLEMVSKSPNKFIVSKGRMHERIKMYPNMWGAEFLDQKAILPQVDLFITHGGHNSIIEAFYYGVPGLIILPVFADQFDSAQRVEDCGFGRRLNPFTCTEEELNGAVDSLLSSPDLGERMNKIGERMRSIKYHEIAAEKLENLLKDAAAAVQS